MDSDQRQVFRDRHAAGRALAAALEGYAEQQPIILALPRGGVPVGYEVARALGAPLDVWVVRKLGVPWHPELGMGAVAEGGHVHLSHEVIESIGLSDEELSAVIAQKRLEVEERVRLFRGERPRPTLRDRTVVLVDDGIATGGTVLAAIQAIRMEGARQIILAVPVAAAETLRALAPQVERVVSILSPPTLFAIGLWYEDFGQVPDAEVVQLLARARRDQTAPPETREADRLDAG